MIYSYRMKSPEAFLERIEGTGAYVAEDNAQGTDGKCYQTTCMPDFIGTLLLIFRLVILISFIVHDLALWIITCIALPFSI